MPFVNLNSNPLFKRPELLRHGYIPRPLSGVSPREIMGQEWWDGQRKEAYAGNNGHCWACGVLSDGLDAHEVYEYDYQRAIATFKEVVALCKNCHAFVHLGHTKNTESERRFRAVAKHGHRVLKKAGLKASWHVRMFIGFFDLGLVSLFIDSDPMPDIQMPPWHKWRMIFEGKEYGPRFDSPAQLEEHYKTRKEE